MRARRQHQFLIGSRIRELRQARSLSLQKLAEIARISVSHLSRVERGLTAPSLTVTSRIATGLGVTPDELTAIGAVDSDCDMRLIVALLQSGIDPDVAQHICDSISTTARTALTEALSRPG